MRRRFALITIGLLWTANVSAQVAPADTISTLTKQVDQGTLDLAAPESPAFTALGLSPTTVTRPSSPQQLVTSLLNGVDEKGNLQTGVAIDSAPIFMIIGRTTTLEAYRKNYFIQLASRFQTSVATAKGSSAADNSVRFGLGFRLTLLDLGDPRSDDAFEKDLSDAASKAMQAVGPAPPLDPQAQEKWKQDVLAAMAPLTKRVRDDRAKLAWNRSAIAIGAAPTWISSDGSVSNLTTNGGALWVSAAYGFEHVSGLSSTSQLLFQYRRLYNSAVAASATTAAYKQDSSLWGAQFKAGTATTNALVEAARLSTSPFSVAPSETYARLAVGVDERIADGIWLHLAVGGEGGHFNGKNQMFVLSEFKWGLVSK